MDFGIALGLAALGKAFRPKAELHWQADYPAEDVFNALLKVIDNSNLFILRDCFVAEKKVLIDCEKTQISKGQEIIVLIEDKDDYHCDIFMISQSKYLENDYGKNQENLDILSDMLLDEYMKLSDNEDYETLRMFHLGYLSEEEYKSIIETDRWWKENQMDEFSANIINK